jgi:peptide chain release factor 1
MNNYQSSTSYSQSPNEKAYIEIRGATGGDEAKLWGSDLLRMYIRYAQKKNWKISQIDDLTIMISAPHAFSLFKNESGVHRVQRVPTTEKRGRIHTSTATVAVLSSIPHRCRLTVLHPILWCMLQQKRPL